MIAQTAYTVSQKVADIMIMLTETWWIPIMVIMVIMDKRRAHLLAMMVNFERSI